MNYGTLAARALAIFLAAPFLIGMVDLWMWTLDEDFTSIDWSWGKAYVATSLGVVGLLIWGATNNCERYGN